MSLGREQFTLVCAECGKGHSGSMAWLQSQRVMVCTRCGAENAIDKDGVIRQLTQRDRFGPEQSDPWVFLAMK